MVCFLSACSKLLYSLNVSVSSSRMFLYVPICATVLFPVTSGYRPGNYGFIQVIVGSTTAYAAEEIIIPR